MAVDGQDRVVVAGHTYGASVDVAVVRLRWNGSLDGTFGGDGRVRIDLGAKELALDVAVAEDRKVVVVGYRAMQKAEAWFVLAPPERVARRHVRRGRRRVHGLGRPFEQANAVAIQPSGKIVVGGSSAHGIYENWAIARYLSGGALDRTFGGDGRVSLALQTGEEVQDAADRGTSIFAGGYAERSYLPTSRSRSCGSTAPGRPRSARRRPRREPRPRGGLGVRPLLQEDGKPVLAGYASSNGKADWGLVRLRAGGGLDGSFSGDGVVTTAFTPAYELATSVGCSPTAGSSSPVGCTEPSGTDDLAIVRYHPGGHLDLSFSATGRRCSTRSAATTSRTTSTSTGARSSSSGRRRRDSRRRSSQLHASSIDGPLPPLAPRDTLHHSLGLTRTVSLWKHRPTMFERPFNPAPE